MSNTNYTQNPSASVDFRQIRFTPPTNRSEKKILIFLLVVRNLVESFHKKYDPRDSHSISVSMPLDQLIDLLHQQLESSLIGFPSTSSFSKTEIIEILHELEKSFSIGKLADYASKTGENIAASSAARANYYEAVIEKFRQDQALDSATKTPAVTALAGSTNHTIISCTATTDVLVATLVEFTVNPWRSGLTDLTATSQFAQTVQQQRLAAFIPPPLRSPLQFDSLKMKLFYEALQRAADSGVASPDEVLNLRPIIPPILGDSMISSNNENSNKNKSTMARNSHNNSSLNYNNNNNSATSARVLSQIDAELNSQSGGVFLPEKDLLLGLSQRHRLAPQVAVPIVNELVRQGKLVKFEYALGLMNNNISNNNNGNSILGMKYFSPLIGISSLVNSNNATMSNDGGEAGMTNYHDFSSNGKTVLFYTPSKFPTFVSRPLYDRFSIPAAFHCALFAYRILGSTSAMLRSDVVYCLQHLGWKNVTILNALIDFLISSTRLKLLVAFSLVNNQNNNNNNNNSNPPLQYLAISEEAKEMFESSRREVMEKLNNNNNNGASSQVVQIRDGAAVEFYNDLKKALLSAGVAGWPKDYLLRLMKIKFNWTETDLEARFFPLLKSWELIQLTFDPKANCANVTITNYNTKVNFEEMMNSHNTQVNGGNNSYFSALSSSATSSLKTATKVYFENLHDLVPPGGLEKSSVITLMNHKHGWKEERTQLEFLSELVSRNLVREVRDAANPAFVKILLVSSHQGGETGCPTTTNQPTADLKKERNENSSSVVTGIKRASLTPENTPVLKIISTFAPNYYVSKLENEEKAKLFLLEYFKMAADQMFGSVTAQQKLCLHLSTLASPQALEELEETVTNIVQQFKANNSTLHQQQAKKIQKSLLFLWIADNVETIHGKTERDEILKSLVVRHKILVESDGAADGTGAVHFHPEFASCFSLKISKQDVESDFHESDTVYSYLEDHYLKMICSAPKATSEVRRTQARFLVNYFRFASIGKREKEPLRANTLQVSKDTFMKWLLNDMGKKQNIVKNQKDFDDLINVLVKSGYLLIVFGGGKQLITLNPAFVGNMKPELLVVPTKPTENQRAEMQRQLNAQLQEKNKINGNGNAIGISGQRRSRSPMLISNNNNNNNNNNNVSIIIPSSVPPPPHQNPVLHIDASNYHFYHQQEEDDFFSENEQSNSFQPPLANTNVNFQQQQHHPQPQQQFQQSSFLDQAFVQADCSVDDSTALKKVDPVVSHEGLFPVNDLLQRVKLPWPHRNPISFPPPLKVVAGVPYFRSKEIYARLMWGPPPFVPNK